MGDASADEVTAGSYILDRRAGGVRSPFDHRSGQPSAGSYLLIRQPWHSISAGMAAPISTMAATNRLKS